MCTAVRRRVHAVRRRVRHVPCARRRVHRRVMPCGAVRRRVRHVPCAGRRVHRRVMPCGAVRRRVVPCGAVCAVCAVRAHIWAM